MTLLIGPEHAAAQVAGAVVFADTGPAHSRIYLYAGADGTGTVLAEVVLAKPCGTVAGGALTLQTEGAAPMVLASGIARSARWVSGAGLLVAMGTVTDVDSGGDFRIAGGLTPPGDNSPSLYAGGAVLLGDLIFD